MQFIEIPVYSINKDDTMSIKAEYLKERNVDPANAIVVDFGSESFLVDRSVPGTWKVLTRFSPE